MVDQKQQFKRQIAKKVKISDLTSGKMEEKEGQKEKPLPKDTFVTAFQKALWDFRFWFFTYLKKEFSRNPLKKQLIRFRLFILRFFKL